MNVNEILARVIEVSHGEDGADSGLRERALGWVNSAYGELMDEILPFVLEDVAVEVLVAYDANGVGTLPTNCRRVEAVFESGRPLEKLCRAEFDAGETGYLVTGGRLHVTPSELSTAGEVRVIYIPHFEELVADGEVAVLASTQQHALIWGALVWGSAYERAFSAQGDLRLFQGKWDEAKRQIKLFFAQRSDVRVAPQFDY